MNVLEKILEEIEEYEKKKCSGESLSAFESGINRGCLEAKNIIRSHMGEGFNTSVPQWIPYTVENMPKKEGFYLVTCDDKRYPVRRMPFKNNMWHWNCGIYDGKILAYQPLPEPYKPQEE